MKALNPVFLMMAAIALLLISVPVQASEMDDSIESSSKQTYVFKTYLKNDNIKIQSKDGVVTLTGTVSEESHKTLAQETVLGMPGVKSVNNKLKLKGEAPSENSDVWLMTKVKTSLLFNRSVSGFATEVDVKNGVVTLHGEASSQAQKDLTTEYAKDVDGVKDVNNKMTVIKTPEKPDGQTTTLSEKIDDASITALVKSSLMYHRSTSGLNTKVVTKDGVVTLSGKAKNEAEKELAAKYAKDVNGAKRVVNNMTAK